MEAVKIKAYCIWEHNGNDSLIYLDNFIGAYTRGASKDEALSKMNTEIMSYLLWRDGMVPVHDKTVEAAIIQEKASTLQIADADSDVLFESEKRPLTKDEYEALKRLDMKSAAAHAKAMFRMAYKTFGKETIPDIFSFSL